MRERYLDLLRLLEDTHHVAPDQVETRELQARVDVGGVALDRRTRPRDFRIFGARAGAKTPGLEKLAKAGVRVLADEFALRERGIAEVAPNIAPTGIDTLVGELASGAKALWN